MREIVFVADDFGMDEAANDAIVRAHVEGALDGAALMMGQAGTRTAAARAGSLPDLQTGWHLHLVDSVPCTLREWPWGGSPLAAGIALGCSARWQGIVREELRAQWEAFCETGLPCRFVNAHHHLHLHPFVRRTLVELLPRDLPAWVRWGEPRFFGAGAARVLHAGLHRALQAPHSAAWPLRVSTTLWGLDRTFAMRATEVAAVLPRLGAGLHEFMFHPRARDDADTRCLLELRVPRTDDGSMR